MLVVRTLVSAITFSLSLFVTSLAFQPGALAQAQSAYQGQIAAFTSKHEEARSTQADLNRLIACLDQHDNALVQQRGKLETRLGRLRSEENNMASKVQTLEAAYKQNRLNFEAEQKKVAELTKSIENMPGRDRYERHMRNCASNNAFDRAACGRYMKNDWSSFARVEANLNAAREREQNAREGMNAKKRNLDETERQLTSTRGELKSAVLEIDKTEKAIGSVKRSVSDVRDVVQPLHIVIDAFTNALDEAKDVNLADQRPRTLRKLGDIAANLDAAMARGRNAALHADKTLEPGWMKSCTIN
jgi:chromosome segregation ATPase